MATARKNLTAILADNGSDMDLRSLAHSLYKYTDAGVSLAARLDNGYVMWNGDEAMGLIETLDDVVALGVSSIVEGSDAEVPLQWLELEGLEPDDAVARFNMIVEDVNDKACRLWDEAHEDDDNAD